MWQSFHNCQQAFVYHAKQQQYVLVQKIKPRLLAFCAAFPTTRHKSPWRPITTDKWQSQRRARLVEDSHCSHHWYEQLSTRVNADPTGVKADPSGVKQILLGSKLILLGSKLIPLESKLTPVGSKLTPLESKLTPVGSSWSHWSQSWPQWGQSWPRSPDNQASVTVITWQ